MDHDVPPSPFTPPIATPPPKSNLPMLYYGLVVVGTAAIVLAVYNLIMIRWCADHHRRSRRGRIARGISNLEPMSSRSFDNPNMKLVSSFRYKKEGVAQGGYEYECPVCLCAFEEGEEVSQLPRCKHSFHAACIDMWLFSHLDCPLCRSPVQPPAPHRHPVTDQSEDSREGLMVDSAVSV
ncbi:RING-H2 finger protein ATL52-like [Cornus florida]|uniref:RING-H2 finger protein ATL52-like n=1 Tax=Cornus florida TaxID=4283 RepID=UPI00289B3992|nr:RING-H2 finger protein ATL52-like [Cornus florida]